MQFEHLYASGGIPESPEGIAFLRELIKGFAENEPMAVQVSADGEVMPYLYSEQAENTVLMGLADFLETVLQSGVRQIVVDPGSDHAFALPAGLIVRLVGELTEKPAAGELRFGHMAGLYYECAGLAVPRQLDLLDEWFPGLIIAIRDEGERKEPAVYDDVRRVINASRYRGRLYAGDQDRIPQILGRLIGTAKGNREKERRTAELIMRHVSRMLAEDGEKILQLMENTSQHVGAMDEEKREVFWERLLEAVFEFAYCREEMDEYARDEELFPMDDEVYEGILYNTAYQLEKGTDEGLANAFLWLLLGGLLRNEAGRIYRIYDSSFVPLYRQMSDDKALTDRLNYLFFPEKYYSYYSGDDLEKRFPGVEWYCDGCGDHLNEQENFDDHLDWWQCRRCGHINGISYGAVYDNEEDYRNGITRRSEEEFQRAVAERKKDTGRE